MFVMPASYFGFDELDVREREVLWTRVLAVSFLMTVSV